MVPGMFSEVPGMCRGSLGGFGRSQRRLWSSLGGPWGVHLGSLGCSKGSLEGVLGPSGGLVGVPGVLLVALGGVFSFLGRSGNGFREIPGDSGSHFGSILDHFFVIFRLIFRLRFLIDF